MILSESPPSLPGVEEPFDLQAGLFSNLVQFFELRMQIPCNLSRLGLWMH